MSNLRFIIDAVPTPKIDLSGAFRDDLEYYVANKKMPPLGRSALSRAEENLNNYLKYVNESFIQGGFSSASVETSIATDTPVAVWANDGTVTFTTTTAQTAVLNIAPAETANIFIGWNLCGFHAPGEEPVVDENGEVVETIPKNGTLHVELWIDAVKQREWRQTLIEGDNNVSASICYTKQPKGTHVVHLKVRLSHGTLAVAANDHYAWGYGQIAR